MHNMALSISDESCPKSSSRALQGLLACVVPSGFQFRWNRNRLHSSLYRSHTSLHRDMSLLSKLLPTSLIYTNDEHLEIISKI